jgi:pimeloyl-ACP methyl ester carboxylesterase
MMSVRRACVALALALAPAGCSSPPSVRVVPRNEWELHRDLDTCALQSDALSARTTWLLRLEEEEEHFRDDPLATIRTLTERAILEKRRDPLFALAELAYLAGKRLKSRECYLAAAVYAYLYLLDEDAGPPPSPYDRRFRWACDIYDRSLVRSLERAKGGGIELTSGPRELPMGSLLVDADLAAFPFETRGLQLLPADEFDVLGLGFRMRDSGLGAPLIAVVPGSSRNTAGLGVLDRGSVSATLFLRIQGGLEDMATGLRARLELHSTFDETSIDVAGARVPLEADPSATIAHGFELAQLDSIGIKELFRGRDARKENGLLLLRPFQLGRIPIVLVHGTASNPTKWAELVNSLQADPVIRARVQFLLFIYTTGNPVIYSAGTLRDSLQELIQLHDPAGKDEALKHMVIVGHSQGGLLTRLMGMHVEADAVCRAVLGGPLDELGLDENGTRTMHRLFDLEPLPFVDRMVFVATPHRGSFLAARWFSRFIARLIAVPGEVAGVAQQVAGGASRERLPLGLEERAPTSLDNMNPDHPVLRYLADTPIDPRIHVHSIIPIGDAAEPEGADDGVVAYESAHLEAAESELLVPSNHSCQSHPRTILELRRILLEHLRSIDDSRTYSP